MILNTENIKDLGVKLKEFRQSIEFTQRDIEALSGVSQSTIQRVERGTTTPSLEVVINLLDILDYDLVLQKREQLTDDKDVLPTGRKKSKTPPQKQIRSITIENSDYQRIMEVVLNGGYDGSLHSLFGSVRSEIIQIIPLDYILDEDLKQANQGLLDLVETLEKEGFSFKIEVGE